MQQERISVKRRWGSVGPLMFDYQGKTYYSLPKGMTLATSLYRWDEGTAYYGDGISMPPEGKYYIFPLGRTVT